MQIRPVGTLKKLNIDRMQIRPVGTLKKLNIEHRTSNFEHPIRNAIDLDRKDRATRGASACAARAIP
jgi:hypothetical protein